MGSILALTPTADATRSPKQDVSDPTKRTNVLQNFFIKMIHMMTTQQEPLCSNMCTQWYTLCCDQSNDKLFIGLENNTKRSIVNKIQNLYIGEVFFLVFHSQQVSLAVASSGHEARNKTSVYLYIVLTIRRLVSFFFIKMYKSLWKCSDRDVSKSESLCVNMS